MAKANLVAMLCNSAAALTEVVTLDPTDPRTRCFKRAVATHISIESERFRIAELGLSCGWEAIDWDTPYCDQLDKAQADRVTKVVKHATLCAGHDPIYAVTHAVRHYVVKDVATMSTDQANEYIRQIVNGIVTPTRS